jgi:aminopeptidase N
MRQWTRQKGHPLVSVNILNNTHISLKQQLFLLDSLATDDTHFKWYIPFTYSIEKFGSNGQSFTNIASISNLDNKIVWFNPEENESKCYY